MAAIESVLSEIDIAVRLQIDMAGLGCLVKMKVKQHHEPSGGRIPNLYCATGHLSSRLFLYLVSDETVPDKTEV